MHLIPNTTTLLSVIITAIDNNSSQHSWYLTSQCHYSCSYDKNLDNHTRQATKQPHRFPVCAPNIPQISDEIYAKKTLTVSPLENSRRPPGRPRTVWMKTIQQDLTSINLSLNEAVDFAQFVHSGDWCLCLVLHTSSGACLQWTNEWMNIQCWFQPRCRRRDSWHSEWPLLTVDIYAAAPHCCLRPAQVQQHQRVKHITRHLQNTVLTAMHCLHWSVCVSLLLQRHKQHALIFSKADDGF